jgi:hypothetical protein
MEVSLRLRREASLTAGSLSILVRNRISKGRTSTQHKPRIAGIAAAVIGPDKEKYQLQPHGLAIGLQRLLR